MWGSLHRIWTKWVVIMHYGPPCDWPPEPGCEEGLDVCHFWGVSGVPDPLIDGDCGVLGPIGLPTCDVGVIAECGDMLAC